MSAQDPGTPTPSLLSTPPADDPATALRRESVGTTGIVFFVLSAQAPLTGIVGAAGLAVALGNGAGAPGAYLLVGAVIVLFAIGFIAMSRHVDAKGGFFAYIAAGLGLRAGGAGSWLALLSYTCIQAAMYGLLGASTAHLLSAYAGLDVPWWVPALATMLVVWVLGARTIEIGARVLVVLVVAEFAILVAFALGVLAVRGLGALDLPGSFSPSAVAAGAPGIAIMFAIASMFGFESTAIYSDEARDPRRSIPRATYVSVVVIAAFFASTMWMVVTYYGASQVAAAAGEALTTDATTFITAPIGDVLGHWAEVAVSFLLVSSLFAGILAFHNMINRYFHAMSHHRLLPAWTGRTNAAAAPHNAALVQTATAALTVLPFAVLGQDPVLTLFGWFSGLAVAALVVLYILTSLSVIAFFRRTGHDRRLWTTTVAPALAAAAMLAILTTIVSNFTSLTGSSPTVAWALLAAVPVAAAIGLTATSARRRELQST